MLRILFPPPPTRLEFTLKYLFFYLCFLRFSLEIETYYTPDGGDKENVFNLSESEKRSRIVDLIDVVKDQVIRFGQWPPAALDSY